jgi:hypothetical protein
MSNPEEQVFDEDVVHLLKSELDDLQKLIINLSKIDSAYKDEFNYLKILHNTEKFFNDNNIKIRLLIGELNQFGEIYAKIVKSDEICLLYIEAGLLDSLELLERIKEKVV